MAFSPDNLGLPETGLTLLRDLIKDRLGLFYADNRCDILSERLGPLVIDRGFRTFLDYYYLLKYDERSEQDWLHVMDALSVQETYFWREADQMRALGCKLMTDLVRTAHGRTIRIWSVPCATGEEPLTIAMALSEGGWFNRASIEIHGSDASRAALQKAEAGRYRARSFRALPPELKDKYFEERDGTASPVASLRARVTSWSLVNLMAREELMRHGPCDVIFCRNAFIYFSPEGVKQVTDAFADLLPTPGYLFVGASESLLSVTDRFMLDDIDRAFVYVKR